MSGILVGAVLGRGIPNSSHGLLLEAILCIVRTSLAALGHHQNNGSVQDIFEKSSFWDSRDRGLVVRLVLRSWSRYPRLRSRYPRLRSRYPRLWSAYPRLSTADLLSNRGCSLNKKFIHTVRKCSRVGKLDFCKFWNSLWRAKWPYFKVV